MPHKGTRALTVARGIGTPARRASGATAGGSPRWPARQSRIGNLPAPVAAIRCQAATARGQDPRPSSMRSASSSSLPRRRDAGKSRPSRFRPIPDGNRQIAPGLRTGAGADGGRGPTARTGRPTGAARSGRFVDPEPMGPTGWTAAPEHADEQEHPDRPVSRGDPPPCRELRDFCGLAAALEWSSRPDRPQLPQLPSADDHVPSNLA